MAPVAARTALKKAVTAAKVATTKVKKAAPDPEPNDISTPTSTPGGAAEAIRELAEKFGADVADSQQAVGDAFARATQAYLHVQRDQSAAPAPPAVRAVDVSRAHRSQCTRATTAAAMAARSAAA